MSRTAGSNGEKTAEAIRRAALRLVYEHGFEGFGLRQLAAEIGLQPASLYNHIASKQDLLFNLIDRHIDDLIARTEHILADCDPDPIARLEAFTAHHLAYHIDKKHEVYVSNFELRALTPPNLAIILAKRRRYEAILIGILDDGEALGQVAVADTHVAAYALLAMLTGACTWYKPKGRLSKADMIELHTRLVLDGWTTGHAAALAGTHIAPARLRKRPQAAT
jgi:AcrR family transcriptional regulator